MSGAVAVEALIVSHGPVPAVRDISFVARPGEVLTLLGPSGCGKTTTLRAIAGLDTPLQGRIAIGGRTVFDATRGDNLPPERRGLSMVFQSYAIWPHMTVFENVAFGLRARGIARSDLQVAVQRSLDLVGLGAFADRAATRLSGGQQQRVALARSIAGDPAVILLDEPLSNLDAQLRLAMRAEFKALQRRLGLTAIYVTHDQEEALVLSDRILVMRDGMIEQAGTPAEIHDTPQIALRRGVCRCHQHPAVRCGGPQDGRPVALLAGGVRLPVRATDLSGSDLRLFPPDQRPHLADAATRAAHAATVIGASYLGDLMQYELRSGEHSICARGLPHPGLVEGAQVFWSVAPDACFLVAA